MGIIIGDTINLSNGLTVANAYGSFGNNEIRLSKNENDNTQYILESHYNIWVNKDNRTNNKSIIDAGNIRKTLTVSELSSNLYSILYTEIKSKFTSTTDDL